MFSRIWSVGLIAFLGYTLWLTVSAARAERAGDNERADELKVRAVLLRLGLGFGLLFLMFAVVFVGEAIN